MCYQCYPSLLGDEFEKALSLVQGIPSPEAQSLRERHTCLPGCEQKRHRLLLWSFLVNVRSYPELFCGRHMGCRCSLFSSCVVFDVVSGKNHSASVLQQVYFHVRVLQKAKIHQRGEVNMSVTCLRFTDDVFFASYFSTMGINEVLVCNIIFMSYLCTFFSMKRL